MGREWKDQPFDKTKFAGASPIFRPGQPQPAPMVPMRMPDGTTQMFPQALVMGIADNIVANIVTNCAKLTTQIVTQEIIGVLQECGVVPEGTLQKYQDKLRSIEAEQATPESNFQSEEAEQT